MKGVKRLLAVAALLCLSGAVQAGWAHNWLLGISGGYTWLEGDVDITILGPEPFLDLNSYRRDIGDSSILGGVFGGYQARCNHWLFGVEFAVDWQNIGLDRPYADTLVSTAPIGPVGISGSTHYSRNTLVGLTGRFGYEFYRNIMVYYRAGAEWSRDKLFVSLATDTEPSVGGSFEGSRTIARFISGVGFEFPIALIAGLTFRTEYNYHAKCKAVDATGAFGTPYSLLVADARPKTRSAKASLVLNFL